MGILEAVLIILGVVFVFASFFVPEKLTDKEVEKISRLSEEQLKVIVDTKLKEAEKNIDAAVDNKADIYSEMAERMLERETNEKIKSISEYSDGVLEQINKTHNEIVFLYSMLNDKHDDIIKSTNNLTALKGEIDAYKEETNAYLDKQVKDRIEQVEEVIERPKQPEPVVLEPVEDELTDEEKNHNDLILEAYKSGMSEVDIARKLGLGIGEVRLVLGLYRGDNINEV